MLGCNSTTRNKVVSSDFNCPRVFFAQEDKVYINNSISVEDIQIKAELNRGFNTFFAFSDVAKFINTIMTSPFNTSPSSCRLS